MRFPTLIVVCVIALAGIPAQSSQFVTEHYQRQSGAIVVETDGDFVDPYFAIKALLTAQDGGLDMSGPALAWIRWLLPRQLRDGRFQRYCRGADGEWHACKSADADDALLALWLELLYRMSPDSGMPPEWKASAAKAEDQLAWLFDHKLGIYAVSRHNAVGLFMDNVEIYAALKDIAASQRRLGDPARAQQTEARAQAMASAIVHIFWDKKHARFRVSTQRHWKQDFYPDAVAQTYAWLLGLPTPEDPRIAWPNWKRRYGAGWMDRRRDPHPWGLVALTAQALGDQNTAACWVAKAAPLRYSADWNVLEEAAYQVLTAMLPPAGPSPRDCELSRASMTGPS